MRGSVLAAFSSLLLAGSAMADGGHFYAGVDLGVVLSAESDQTYTPGMLAGSTGNLTADLDLGFNGSAAFGYDFGSVRVELEAGYISAGVDGVTSDFPLPSGGTSSQSAEGDISGQSFMANVIVDLGAIDDFTFFIGGGAGYAKLDFSELALPSASPFLDDDSRDWRFAWQAMAGVRKPLSDRLDIHVRYRYFDAGDTELIGFGGRVVDAGLTSHAVSVGLTFNF